MRGWTTMKWLGLCLAVLGLLAACGGGADRTKAQVRLVNASSGYSALSLVVDDETKFASIAYGGSDAYVEVDPDKTASEVRRAGSSTALVSFTPALSKDNHYTVLAYGGEGALKTLLLDDNTDRPDDGKTQLRVVNAAPDAGAVDVYITGTDDLLTDAVALQPAAPVGTVNGFVTINSGTRRLRVTAAGSKTDLRLDLSTLSLPDERVVTLVITPGAGGVLVNALLLVDEGGIARNDTPQARVRVAAAVTDGGSVSASIGGTALMTGVGAPAVSGTYTLVTAGSATPVVSVNGAAVTTTATTLTAGADYTLMVYGPASAPVAVWLDDDNRLPTDTAKAKVRLVHGLADVTTALALSIDFVPVADSVTQGTASLYYDGLDPVSAAAALSVTTTNQVDPVFSAVDQTFVASGNYTLFVVGSAFAPTGILRKDR